MRSNEQMSEQIVGLKTNGWALTDESREEFFRTNNDDNMSAQERVRAIRGIPLDCSCLGRQRMSPDRPGRVSRSNRLQNRF